jgi:hypothetical protein
LLKGCLVILLLLLDLDPDGAAMTTTWIKFAERFFTLAATIPLTVMIANAQFSVDDLGSYSQNLQARLYQGQATGQLSSSEFNNLQALYNNVETVRRSFGNRQPKGAERIAMMNSLTNLDRQITDHLHDNEQSRYQYWDANRNDWRADSREQIRTLLPVSSHDVAYNNEIEPYIASLHSRLESGRHSGRLTPSEYSNLSTRLDQIESLDHNYQSNWNFWRRNSIMNMLTKLDQDIVVQLHDDDMARYKYWDTKSNKWNHQWWQNGWKNPLAMNAAVVNPVVVNPIAGTAPNQNYWNNGNRELSADIDSFQQRLRDKLQQGEQSGRLTRNELSDLNNQYDQIDSVRRAYRHGGMNQSEHDTLTQMLTRLDSQINAQMRDDDRHGWHNGNGNGSGNGNGHGWHHGWGNQ